MRLRRILSWLVLTSFIWVSVITPAKAFLPLIALAVEAAASDVAFSTALGLSTAAIGSAIAFIKFRDPNNSGTVLTVQIDPKAKLETPGGWSPPTTSIQPIAPSTVPTIWRDSSGASDGDYSSPQAAAVKGFTRSIANGYSNYPNASQPMGSPSCTRVNINSWSCQALGANGTTYTETESQVTQAGYANGDYPAPATLTNTALAVKPALGRHMMTRSGNAFVKDSQQNPADDLAGNTSAFSAPGTGILTARNPSTGETTTITINQTDGSTTVVTTKTNADGTTSTRTTTTISAPDLTNNIPPKVSGQKTEQLPGVGDAVGAPSTTATPSVSVAVDTSNLATHSDVSGLGAKVDSAKNQAASDAAQAHSDAEAMKAKQDKLDQDLQVTGTVNQPGALTPPTSDILYTQKYPNGFSGMWDTKKAAFMQTGVGGLMSMLTPTVGTGGSCPSWTVNLDLGSHMMYGSHDMAPPCTIWPILKIIFIVTTLFVARGLVFGG